MANTMSSDSSSHAVDAPSNLADLRALTRAIEASVEGESTGCDRLAFGMEAMDGRLGGGLALGALHEVAGASPELADDAAASLFAAGIAARAHHDPGAASARPVLWALAQADLYAPGLAQAGLPPARLICAEGGDDACRLALAEDALHDGSVAAVVVEARVAPMVATRRLHLAARAAGIPVLLLKRWRRCGADPLALPSAAASRWRIAPARSARLGVMGVARARWQVDCVRLRGGDPFSLVVEACDETGRIAVPAAARDRAAAARTARVRSLRAA